MTAGLPGTGIGGLFYLLLAIYMPVREFFRTLQGRTTLKRWGVITLQLLFVAGILAAMWGEVWALNRALFWLKEAYHIDIFSINGPLTFRETRTMAITCAYASFVSLTFVLAVVTVLRFFVSRPHIAKSNSFTARKMAMRTNYQPV
jgi:hypothetical protein